MMTKLSASRIKTLQDCSWVYWCNYILKLPQTKTPALAMGSACHGVFECLGNPRHKHHYKAILDAGDIAGSPAVYRYVEKFLQKDGCDPSELVKRRDGESEIAAIDHCNNMILSGLRYDFFGESVNPDESVDEISFDIEHDDGETRYHIRGFIDKLFLFKNKTRALIRDFKSNKRLFCQKDIEDNTQDLMYRLAVAHLYPDVVKRETEFYLLQFGPDEGSVKTPDVSDAELEGFKHFLTDIQNTLDNFTRHDATRQFAADKGYVDKYHGFAGLLKCGVYGKTSADHPDAKKVNGDPMWYCECKFAYFYYVLLNDDGKILATAIDSSDLPEPQDGQVVKRRYYEGCPKFQHLDYNKKMLLRAEKEGFA